MTVSRAAVVLLTALLASCSSSAVVPQTSTRTTAVKVVLNVPRPSATASRRSQYISPATQSVVINNYYGINTTASSPNCTTVTRGLQCTVTIQASIGNNQPFEVTAYDQPLTSSGRPQGNQLSTGTVWANITEGVANVVKVTLLGTPAEAKMTIADSSPPMGTAASIPITLTIYDADGYAIVGQYSSAIQLTTQNGAYLSFTVNGQNTSLVSSPSDVIALQYPGYATVSATIDANVQFATAGDYLASTPFTPQPGFGTEKPVGTSLVGASAWRDSSYQRRTWFTEPAKHKVAVYPKGGSIAEYSAPSGAALLRMTGTPLSIYCTESSNSVAEWSTSAETPFISEHSLSTPSVGVYQIGGEDLSLNMYFTENSAGKIGKLNPSGSTLTEFSTGNPNSTPAGITSYNETAWIFADPGANALAIVTNAGGFTYFPVPTAGAKPTEISNGSNGYWWFTEPGASQIGKINANGNIAEYASPGQPVAIIPEQSDVFVLTTAGNIEDYDPSSGALRNTYTPPASTNGPAVGIFDGNDASSLIVLRSDGTNGSIQPFYYD